MIPIDLFLILPDPLFAFVRAFLPPCNGLLESILLFGFVFR
jgi:hypothetical protein